MASNGTGPISTGFWRLFGLVGIFLSLVGLVAILAIPVVWILVSIGVLTPEKIANFLKFNPAVTGMAPAKEEEFIQTNFARLKAIRFNLSAMASEFQSGGGAIAEWPGGILVAGRNGTFHFFTAQNGEAKLKTLPNTIDINQQGFERFASAEGYAIRPGTNVGFAGLGMRLHDIYITHDQKTLLVSHTIWHDDRNCATLRVVAADISGGDGGPAIGAWQTVFESKPCLGLSGYKAKPFAGHQAGGRMQQTAPGKILLTIGDFKNDGVKRDVSVDDVDVDYGKIHEIDLASGTSRVFSTGHRNPQGLLVTAKGLIWETEHGPTGGDELNLIEQGKDYGWPKVTLGQDCHGCDWQVEGRHDGFAPPAFSFVPSIGISSVIEIAGFVPNWEGDLLVASMVGQSLHHLRLNGTQIVYDEPIQMSDRLRDMVSLSGGRVAVWTDSGRLVILTVEEEETPIARMSKTLSISAQEVLQQCGTCHEVEKGVARQGKLSLHGVMGRSRGGSDFPTYSAAMKAAGGVWDAATLDAFLANPQANVPGTNMAFEGIEDAGIRKEIVDFLGKLQ